MIVKTNEVIGKNLFDYKLLEIGKWIPATGVVYNDSTGSINNFYYNCEPNETFYLKTNLFNIIIAFYDSNKNFIIRYNDNVKRGIIVTAPINAAYYRYGVSEDRITTNILKKSITIIAKTDVEIPYESFKGYKSYLVADGLKNIFSNFKHNNLNFSKYNAQAGYVSITKDLITIRKDTGGAGETQIGIVDKTTFPICKSVLVRARKTVDITVHLSAYVYSNPNGWRRQGDYVSKEWSYYLFYAPQRNNITGIELQLYHSQAGSEIEISDIYALPYIPENLDNLETIKYLEVK